MTGELVAGQLTTLAAGIRRLIAPNPGMMTGPGTNTYLFPGGLGPLGLMGVSGNMTWEFEDHEDGMQLTLNYAVGGYLNGGLDAVAEAVDGVLVEQIENLRKLVEAGDTRDNDKSGRGQQLASGEAVFPRNPDLIES